MTRGLLDLRLRDIVAQSKEVKNQSVANCNALDDFRRGARTKDINL